MMFFKKQLFLLTVLSLLLGSISAEAGLRIYYIRHAEGGHNVRKDWEKSDVPESKWPSYVGDPDVFTPLGKTQLEAVPAKLKELEYRFDFFASSPLWRSRNTILPYMKEFGAKGEIWPELKEYSCRSEYLFDPKLPKVSDPVLGEGPLIVLPDSETDWFSLLENAQHHFEVPDDYEDDERLETAAGKLVLQVAIDRILKRFGGKDKAILLAGHGASGKTLFRMLTNDVDADSIDNTGIWMVEQQPDGTFRRMMYNTDFVAGPGSMTVRFEDLRADLSDGEINGESDDDSNVTIKKSADGLDVIYSLSIANQDFDGVGGDNDSLSWDIRFSGYKDGKISLDGNDSSVSLGAHSQVYMKEPYFGVSDKRYVDKDDSIQFTIENVVLKTAAETEVKFNGFDEIFGTDDSYVFGVGDSGLKSKVTKRDERFDFPQVSTLTLSCPTDKFRVRDLSGSFTVTCKGGVNFHKNWIQTPDAQEGEPYKATIADTAKGDSLTYSKLSGPDWLKVAASGALSGTPAPHDVSTNVFKVQATNTKGVTDTTTLVIKVNQ